MIPLFKVAMNDNAVKKTMETLKSGYIGQGKVVDEFEFRLQDDLGLSQPPVLLNSCTSAIDLALELCGVLPDEDVEVISTPQTCFATNVGPINRNARIRWADINPDTGLIDPVSVGKLINEKTRAIIAVNWAGKFCDYEALKSFGVPVIEDAAHTWDTFLKDKPARGDYVCYSLQAIKFLTAGDGGILVTPENKNHDARLLRWYGLDRTKNESFRITQNIKHVGYKYNMNDIAASIGISNLETANNSVISHRENARLLTKMLSGLKSISIQKFDEESSYWIFPVIINSSEQTRDAFIKHMKDNGIETAMVHYRNDLFDATKKFSDGNLPGVNEFTKRQTNIPCGWWMTEEDISYVIDKVLEWDKICQSSQ
jgi:dTDP-4-amino-4,6-dideoxygalactose transaminase